MTITATEFKQIYPEFEGVSDIQIQHAIAITLPRLSETRWKSLYTPAFYSLVAHSIYLRQQTQLEAASDLLALDQGQRLQRREGGFNEAGLNYYNRSPYGAEYLALKKQLPCVGGHIHHELR